MRIQVIFNTSLMEWSYIAPISVIKIQAIIIISPMEGRYIAIISVMKVSSS